MVVGAIVVPGLTSCISERNLALEIILPAVCTLTVSSALFSFVHTTKWGVDPGSSLICA